MAESAEGHKRKQRFVSGGAWMLEGVKSNRVVAESRSRGLRGLLPGRHIVLAKYLCLMVSRRTWSGGRPASIVSVVRLVPGAAAKMVARAQVSTLVRARFQLGARAPRTGATYSSTGLMQLV